MDSKLINILSACRDVDDRRIYKIGQGPRRGLYTYTFKSNDPAIYINQRDINYLLNQEMITADKIPDHYRVSYA